VPFPAFGWSQEAHQAIAIIATNRLAGTPTAAKLSAILGSLTLASIAVCPDQVRELEAKEIKALKAPCNKVFPNPVMGTEQWHFVNTPIKDAAFTPTSTDVETACNEICVINQIPYFLAILQGQNPKPPGGRKQPKFTKLQALSFVVHFIGDVHQPLHSADRDGDGGGNAEVVKFFADNNLKLHGIWDNQIVAKIDKTDTELASDLNSEISDAAKEPPATPMDWALEAYIPARDVAYHGVPPEPKVAKGDEAPEVATLGQSYQDAAAPKVRQQIARAGVRLADALRTALP
jgi:nuclease S1